MKTNRPHSAAVRSIALGLLMLACSLGVMAQSPEWPTKPVRLVVGLPPGSGMDLLARGLAQRLTSVWGQPVVVENRPGASTIIATEAVAHAAPDGYTLLFGLDVGFTINPYLYAKLPYDPIKDFAPVTLITSFGLMLVCNPSLPVKSVPELIALARSQRITYGSIGAGSQMHLASEMLNNKTGIKLVHVPYKGIPQMMLAVVTGEVQLAWAGVYSTRPQVAAGKLRALGYSGAKRSPLMPDVPTLGELGYPEAEISAWYGVLAPAETPRPIIQRIHADISKLLADPEFRDKEMLSKAYEPIGAGPEEFAAYIKRELASRAEVVRISGAKAE